MQVAHTTVSSSKGGANAREPCVLTLLLLCQDRITENENRETHRRYLASYRLFPPRAHIIPDTSEGVLGGVDILFRWNGTVLPVS